jgi:hypothetical protein
MEGSTATSPAPAAPFQQGPGPQSGGAYDRNGCWYPQAADVPVPQAPFRTGAGAAGQPGPQLGGPGQPYMIPAPAPPPLCVAPPAPAHCCPPLPDRPTAPRSAAQPAPRSGLLCPSAERYAPFGAQHDAPRHAASAQRNGCGLWRTSGRLWSSNGRRWPLADADAADAGRCPGPGSRVRAARGAKRALRRQLAAHTRGYPLTSRSLGRCSST